jgi:hypothetical protein
VEQAAVFAVDDLELLGGSLPVAQRRLVEAWAELLQSGRPPLKIDPLR